LLEKSSDDNETFETICEKYSILMEKSKVLLNSSIANTTANINQDFNPEVYATVHNTTDL